MQPLSRTAATWPAESADRRAERCRAWLYHRRLLGEKESKRIKGVLRKKRKGKK